MFKIIVEEALDKSDRGRFRWSINEVSDRETMETMDEVMRGYSNDMESACISAARHYMFLKKHPDDTTACVTFQ